MTDKHSRSNREKSQNIERGKWGCPVGYMIMKKARRRDKQSSSTTTQGVDYLPVINKLGRSNGKGKKIKKSNDQTKVGRGTSGYMISKKARRVKHIFSTFEAL